MATVLARGPNVTGAAGHGNTQAKGVAGRVNTLRKVRGSYGTTVTISCDAKPGYALSIQGDSVVLVPARDSDPNQKWDKDDSWGDGFAIVNEATGQAIEGPDTAGQRLRLVQYNTTKRDNKVIWNKDGDSSSPIREYNNNTLVFDYNQSGNDFVVIVSGANATAAGQKWTIKRNN